MKSLRRNIPWSPQQRAEHRAIREATRRERPGPDELSARGEIDEGVPLAQVVSLRLVLKRLKAERERRGLSLTDVSERSGLTRPMISRLENGWNLNPTLSTLFQYALGVGLSLDLLIDEARHAIRGVVVAGKRGKRAVRCDDRKEAAELRPGWKRTGRQTKLAASTTGNGPHAQAPPLIDIDRDDLLAKCKAGDLVVLTIEADDRPSRRGIRAVDLEVERASKVGPGRP